MLQVTCAHPNCVDAMNSTSILSLFDGHLRNRLQEKCRQSFIQNLNFVDGRHNVGPFRAFAMYNWDS